MRSLKIINHSSRKKKLKAAIIILTLLLTTNKTRYYADVESKTKRRRWWTRPWLDRSKGNLSLVQKDFACDPEQFRNFLRMDDQLFNIILSKVSESISKKNTFMRETISAKDKLAITLRFLATGETYRSLMYSFRIAESTISLFIPVVCKAIYEALKDDYLQAPRSAADWLNIAQDFERRWNFPNAIGASDGKHIVFNAPTSAGSTYYNYKGQNSIVLLALVDSQYKFIYVDAGTNGRVSDGGVFKKSTLYKGLVQNKLHIPEDKPLPGRHKTVPYVIVADAAFSLHRHILKPYPFRNLNPQQQVFNYRLSRARQVVENAFGILANRFRIFLTPINLSPEKVEQIILTCCALHNFLRVENVNYITENEDIAEDVTYLYGLAQQKGNHPTNEAMEIRNEFMHYFNNEGNI